MLPNVATFDTYGGPLDDYSAVRDSTRDRPAAGTNPAYADVSGMTHTALRAWARFQPNGTSAVTLPASNIHDETWNNGRNAAPVSARSGVGTFTVSFPAVVYDEIPSGMDGATPAGFAVNLRMPGANLELGSTTNYDVRIKATSPNILTVKIFTAGTSTLVDPNDGTIVGVWAA